MRRWYPDVARAGSANDADLVKAIAATDYYAEQYNEAKEDLNFSRRMEYMSSRLPGLTEHRFAQLQDMEGIIEHLEDREKRAVADKMRYYLEHYQRTVTDRTAREYAAASDEAHNIRMVIREVAAVRNLYLGIMKSFEYMHFQITNLTKLKCAGLEDAEISLPRDHH